MNEATTVLKVARAELKAGVRENPPHSNTGWRILLYQSHTWLRGTGWPWCFPAGTLIDTPTGLRAIETTEPGDWVLDHEGTPRRALEVKSRLAEHCVRVRAQGVDTTTTPEHPFLVRRAGEEQWVTAGGLERGDWICLPQLTLSARTSVLLEQAYLLGRYLADGWSQTTRRNNARTLRRRAYLCGALSERTELELALAAAGAGSYITERRTNVQVELLGGEATAEFYAAGGHSALTKQVPADVFGWDAGSRQAVLDGYGDGDGSVYRDGYRAQTVSRALALGITRLARTLGYVTSFTERSRTAAAVIEDRHISQATQIYNIAWASPSVGRSGMRFDSTGRAWATVKKVDPVEPRPVFNLTVEDTHTFVADGVAVHNCAAFVNFVYDTAGVPLPFKTAGAYDMLDRARRIGWAASLPQPGCAAVFNIGAGHVAIVEKWTAGEVTTIDGNAGDAVTRNIRPRSLVRGYVVPPKLRASGTPPAVTAKQTRKATRKPHYELVTSINGTTKLVVSDRPLAQLVAFLPRVLQKRKNVTIRRSKR